MIRQQIAIVMIVTAILAGCNNRSSLDRALELAGENRPELEAVLNHYKDNSEKLAAARFLIENMPAHFSYAGNEIYQYYECAAQILANKDLTPEQQRDSLLAMSTGKYSNLPNLTIPDAQIIKADFLIDNIDKSYAQWTTCPWASQLTFEQYLEWLLPYKGVELQELDHWRDTLFAHFGTCLNYRIKNDVEYNTVMHVADTIRIETYNTLRRYSLNTKGLLPLLNSHLQAHQTFGDTPDYTLTAVLTFRSAGIPAFMDETPVGPRGEAATRWFVLYSDRGEEYTSEWDLLTAIGKDFFPYERGPKVYRNTYAINKEREQYKRKAKFQYPFELGKKDVTSKYFLTSNISIPIESTARKHLKDKYVYIASAVRDDSNPWQIVDFGTIRNGKACFHDMGREVLYTVMGYDGNSLIQITSPFILHKDQRIEYINGDTISSPSLDKWKNNAL